MINVAVLILLIFAFGREYVGNLQIEQEIAMQEAEREDLKQEELATLSLIQQLSSEYFLETEGRTKQGLGKEGEQLVIITGVEEEVSEESAGFFEAYTEGGISNPMRWFYYFFRPDVFSELGGQD